MSQETTARTGDFATWRAALSGFCASFVGIGLARFVYTALIPAQIAASWFTPAQSGYLGAANLAGYLAGALLARSMASRWNAVHVVRAMMALTAATFFLSDHPVSFLFYFGVRFLSGFGGGALMVLAAPIILPHVPPERRGLVAGAVFTGVGLGMAVSGAFTAQLLNHGLTATWDIFGFVAVGFTIVGWTGWPSGGMQAASGGSVNKKAERKTSGALRWLFAEYGLCGVALVPHMVFLVDFVSRGLGSGIEAGARSWIVAGVGAVLGPIAVGRVADLIGFRLALRATIVIEAIAIVATAASRNPLVATASAFALGAFVSGCVPLTLGRIHDLVHSDRDRQQAWAYCTILFSLGLAVSAYFYSYIFAVTGTHAILFFIAAGAMVAALCCDLMVGRSAAGIGATS
jgi:predicted MFS family arabinose efflux permease